MEITTNAIEGGAPRRSTLAPVAARMLVTTPCATTNVGAPTYVGQGSVQVHGGKLHRNWHEAQLTSTGVEPMGAGHRLGRVADLCLKPSFQQGMSVTDGNVTFNANFIARSGPPCSPSV